jgi:hypothetical protein
MATLHLGVHDIAYAAAFAPPSPGKRVLPKGFRRIRTKSKAQQAYGSGKTTGDIAEILESRYKIMRVFFDMEKAPVIIPAVVDSMKGAVVNMMMGQPGPMVPTAQAMETIKTRFKTNLSMRRYDGKIRGVPTEAARLGVSHRFKRPYARRPERPSFIDSGLYQSSFTAWMEG